MMVKCRKMLCCMAFALIVFHLLFPISFDTSPYENTDSAIVGTVIFVWEFFQPGTETAKISGVSSRYFFQSVRENLQKTIPVGISTVFTLKTNPVMIRQYLSIGVVISMMFLTIIIYIFRSDGKKRYVNN